MNLFSSRHVAKNVDHFFKSGHFGFFWRQKLHFVFPLVYALTNFKMDHLILRLVSMMVEEGHALLSSNKM